MSNISPLKKNKDEMREKYRLLRAEVSSEEKAEKEAGIINAALSMASYRYAEYVLLYAACEGEINIDEIALHALKKGKKVAYPRCIKQNHIMNYHMITSLDELSVDTYGIREPSPEAEIYNSELQGGSAVIFVPGLVYDKAGYRLGYGKGFYDRYLTSFRGTSIGVVYDSFIEEKVPRGRFDTRVDILLTEKGVKITGEN